MTDAMRARWDNVVVWWRRHFQLEVGNLVQINPELAPELCGACMVVLELGPTHIVGLVSVPDTPDQDGHQGAGAVWRLKIEYHAVVKVGHAKWIAETTPK